MVALDCHTSHMNYTWNMVHLSISHTQIYSLSSSTDACLLWQQIINKISYNYLTAWSYKPCVHIRSRLPGLSPASGTSPGKQDFPRQSHSVDARRDFSRWSHQTCWVRGRKSDLGLVIDIAQLFSSNVRMREMWWHGDLTHSPFAQQKPLNRDCPRKAGHSMIVWTVGRKKDKTSPNCPRQTGPSLNAGKMFPLGESWGNRPTCRYIIWRIVYLRLVYLNVKFVLKHKYSGFLYFSKKHSKEVSANYQNFLGI